MPRVTMKEWILNRVTRRPLMEPMATPESDARKMLQPQGMPLME
jgi:hypothetical protein